MRLLLAMCMFLIGTKSGSELFNLHCSSCHGEDRLGRTAPPLIPSFLKSDDEIIRLIEKGSDTGMPSFNYLKEEEIKKIIEFIRSPIDKEKITWDENNIKQSEQITRLEKLNISNVRDYTLFVERGKKLVWVLEGEKILLKFDFPNIHGGIKFSNKNLDTYIPSRDGWIGKFSPTEGYLKKVRACIYLRNLAVSRDSKYVATSCWIPSRVMIFDQDLNLVKMFDINGKINVIYELYETPSFIFTLKDKSYVGFIDFEEQKIGLRYVKIDTNIEDSTIDPLEEYLIASTTDGLKIYSLRTMENIAQIPELGALPHLLSASFWYSNGEFFLATPLVKKSIISVIKAYKWEHIKDIDGKGFLARSSYKIPHIWINSYSGSIFLLDKFSLEFKTLNIDQNISHVEFSGDGKIAYLSTKDGFLILFDTYNFEKIAEFQADFPAGKYNFMNKSRKFEAAQIGYQVFMHKCWGCHHISSEAFGPPLASVAQKRDIGSIVAQIIDPEKTSKMLGYKRNAMPKINITEQELKSLMKFIELLKEGWLDW